MGFSTRILKSLGLIKRPYRLERPIPGQGWSGTLVSEHKTFEDALYRAAALRHPSDFSEWRIIENDRLIVEVGFKNPPAFVPLPTIEELERHVEPIFEKPAPVPVPVVIAPPAPVVPEPEPEVVMPVVEVVVVEEPMPPVKVSRFVLSKLPPIPDRMAVAC